MAEVNGSSPQPVSQSTPPPPTASGASNPTTTTAANTQGSDPSSQQQHQQQIPSPPTTAAPLPAVPPTSLSDPGTSPRPRDARTIHLLLSSLGVAAYQDRVPLQLLDFAYRYTSSVLSDAQHLAAEGYVSSSAPSGGSGKGAAAAAAAAAAANAGGSGEISLAAVRLAASSRLGYQFSTQGAGGGAGALPKEALLELAQERNKYKLPAVQKEEARFGVRLPAERYCLTGGAWKMVSEWDGVEEGDEGEMGENGDAGDVLMGEGEEGDGDGFDRYAADREDMEEGDEDLTMDD